MKEIKKLTELNRPCINMDNTKPMQFLVQSDNENLSPKEFLERYSLPRIVNIIPEEPVAKNGLYNPVCLLSGKLLIYKQYSSGKIEARSFSENKSNNKHNIFSHNSSEESENSSTIVIPDTYDGWFSVVTERGQIKAKLYTSIQHLITAHVTAFLIIAPNLVGYIENPKKNSDSTRHQYNKAHIKSGQVLKLLAIYQDIGGQSSRSKRLSWPLLGSRHETTQYVQCLTSTKQIVYIPATTHGHFYSVSTATKTAEDNISKVYQINKLLQVFPLPVRVCIIWPNASRGSMLLETYHKEDVMLACTLDSTCGGSSGSTKFRFLEIDITSKFYINCVADENRLFKSSLIQEALRNCHNNSDQWCQQLKVIHYIYPEKDFNKPYKMEPPSITKPAKKSRKISLGDRKTVKSASFRYSTSYKLDNNNFKPLYKSMINTNNSSNMAEIKSNSENRISKINIREECSSSLPVASKTDKNYLLTESSDFPLNMNKTKILGLQTKQPCRIIKNSNPIERLDNLTGSCNNIQNQYTDNNNCSYQKSQIINAPTVLTTKPNFNNCNNNYSENELVTKMNCMNIKQSVNNNDRCDFNYSKYRVLKKSSNDNNIINHYNNNIIINNNNYVNGLNSNSNINDNNMMCSNSSNIASICSIENECIPVHKTRIKIQINGPYSNVVDAVETNRGGFNSHINNNNSNQENIYAEINESRNNNNYYNKASEYYSLNNYLNSRVHMMKGKDLLCNRRSFINNNSCTKINVS